MTSLIDLQIGARMLKLRAAKELSKKEVATRLRLSECDLAEIEAGEIRASAEILMAACKLFQVNVAVFYQDIYLTPPN